MEPNNDVNDVPQEVLPVIAPAQHFTATTIDGAQYDREFAACNQGTAEERMAVRT